MPSSTSMALDAIPARTHVPYVVSCLGGKGLRVLSAACSSKTISILGFSACFAALCVLLLQTAVSSLGISAADHDSLRLEALFPFFRHLISSRPAHSGFPEGSAAALISCLPLDPFMRAVHRRLSPAAMMPPIATGLSASQGL